MIKLKQLEKLESDYLAKLTVTELKSYILDLATEYYISIASKDNAKIKTVLEAFDKIKDLHKEKNVEAYIKYALITVFIKVILNSTSAVNLKEPKLTTSKKEGNYLINRPTELVRVIEHFRFKKIFERQAELTEANLSTKEIEELFHYEDYIEGVNTNGKY